MSVLYNHHHGMHGEKNPVDQCIYIATREDILSVAREMGGHVLTFHSDGARPLFNKGSYLVLKLSDAEHQAEMDRLLPEEE